MLVLDGGKGLMLGYWLGCRRGKFQKQSPLDGGSQATILYVSDPNTGFPGGSDSKDSACYAGAAAATQLLQGCLTLCDLTACSPPGSSVHGDWEQGTSDFRLRSQGPCRLGTGESGLVLG